MKIWGNHLEVGDTIYYEYDLDIKQSTIKYRDVKSFRMPSFIMENGDRIFVNGYYYTKKQEAIDNLLDELKNKCKRKLDETTKQMEYLKHTVTMLNYKLKNLENFN